MAGLKENLTHSTETKPGVYTTEFLFALLFNLGGAAELATDAFNLPNQWVVIAMAVVASVYAASRGLAKQNGVYVPIEDYDPNDNPNLPPQV